MSKRGRQRLVQSGIAFGAAVAVWLVFYFWFPSTPLTVIEFLVVFVIAYLGVVAVNGLVSWRQGRRAGPGAANEQDGT